MSAKESPAKIHSKLKHPVVDGDGHWLDALTAAMDRHAGRYCHPA